jgi:hypothetical protein
MPLLPTNIPSAETCGSDWSVPSYLYMSDGVNYKLMVHCAGTGQAISKSRLVDPNRPVWSLSVTNNHAVTDAW